MPLDGKTITDDTRIRASVPTVKYLMEKGAKVLLSSHLGRPKDGPEDKFSLGPVAPRLTELLGKEVVMAPDCIGDAVKSCVDGMSEGSVLLLENTRFYKEEEKNVPEFAEKLAANADLFVNDAFGTAHRAHSSMVGVKGQMPCVSGLLVAKELEAPSPFTPQEDLHAATPPTAAQNLLLSMLCTRFSRRGRGDFQHAPRGGAAKACRILRP